MGVMRFWAPQRQSLPHGALERAYLAGMEAIPWASRNSWQGEHLVLEREVADSANLYIPWRVPGYGEIVLSTTTLMERDAPYHLPVELARGTLNRLRNQSAAWQQAGLVLPDDFAVVRKQAVETFARAAILQRREPLAAAEHADAAAARGLEAIALLAGTYSDQVLKLRRQAAPRLATLLGCSLDQDQPPNGEAEQFLSSFNAAAVPLAWRELEPQAGKQEWDAADRRLGWVRRNGLKVFGGPLLKLDRGSLPDWIYLWEEDFDALLGYVRQHLEAVVRRYAGQVHIWHCAAGLNVGGALGLSEEQKLRLCVAAIDVVRRLDGRAPVIISFDQPWAEFLRDHPLDLSPLHFADALVRAELGVAGIGLQVNLGYWPGGTLPRDLLDVSRQIDRWSTLGLPLLIMLTAPSNDQDDPLAQGASRPISGAYPEGWTPGRQQSLVEQLTPLLISKQAVHGVVWGQWSDAVPHEFAHSGLLDADRRPKPALSALQAIRREHLA